MCIVRIKSLEITRDGGERERGRCINLLHPEATQALEGRAMGVRTERDRAIRRMKAASQSWQEKRETKKQLVEYNTPKVAEGLRASFVPECSVDKT